MPTATLIQTKRCTCCVFNNTHTIQTNYHVECCLNGWVITDICLDVGGYNNNDEEQDEYAELEGVEFYPDM